MPTLQPNSSQPPSRLRSLSIFVVALMYAFFAEIVAHHAANGLSSGDYVPLLDRAIALFLLIIGFSGLRMLYSSRRGAASDRRNSMTAAVGLVSRPGVLREFGVGAAVGWGLLLLTILPSVFIGGLGISVFPAPHQWFLLVLDLLVLGAAALTQELIFRGYPFLMLERASGPTLATVLMSIFFVVVHYEPGMPHAAVFSLFLLSVILSIGFLRTRALWLPWGLHFAWNAAAGPLFGLPMTGYRTFARGFSPVVQSLPAGPDALTGGDYGPEGSAIAIFVLCFGLWLILRVTRDYAHRYAGPEIIPAGIPVDIDGIARRQHEAAMGPVQPAAPQLVQIAPPAGAPLSRPGDVPTTRTGEGSREENVQFGSTSEPTSDMTE